MSDTASEATATTAPDPPAEPAPAKEQPATDYVILARFSDDEEDAKVPLAWIEQSKVTARSAKAAVRAWLDQDAAKPEGTFIAVPARSWQPITVNTETQTKITLS